MNLEHLIKLITGNIIDVKPQLSMPMDHVLSVTFRKRKLSAWVDYRHNLTVLITRRLGHKSIGLN